MFVGYLQLMVLVPQSHSLKEKRAVLRAWKDRVRDRFGLPLVEVGGQDTWQRAELGLSVVGMDHSYVERVLGDVERLVADGGAVAAASHRVLSVPALRPSGANLDQAAARTGAGDKAAAACGETDWLPAAWRDDEEETR